MRRGKALWVGLAGLAMAGSVSVRAADYALYTTVGEVNTQTSAAGPQATDQYRFSIRNRGGQFGDIALQKPDGTYLFPNPFSPSQFVFPDRDALATQFPSGTYQAYLEYRQTPISPPTPQTINGDATLATSFPPAPEIINGIWENGVLMAEENQLTLNMAPWVGRPNGSFIGFTMAFETKQIINGPAETVVFSGLQPGMTYNLDIMYMNPEHTSSVNLPGPTFPAPNTFSFIRGGSAITRVTVQTVPEPGVWQLGVAGAAGALIISRGRNRAGGPLHRRR